jgi:hypothetical protein
LCNLPACSEKEEASIEAGALGTACDLDKTSCDDELLCTEDEDGEGVCTLPPGAECDPDASELDNGGCALSAVCEAPTSEGDAGADGSAMCRLEEGAKCNPDEDYCANGLSCVEVVSGGHRCFGPVLLQGRVTDTSTALAVEGAHVIGIDAEGSAATSVAISAADGSYSLTVPVARNDDGSPSAERFTLRAAAQDYQSFPFGVRVALPIDVDGAEAEGDGWVVDNALTQVGLIPLPAGERYRVSGSLSGVSAKSNLTGVLVVASSDGVAFSATTDKDGAFTIFNVTDGDYELVGYGAELQLEPEPAKVSGKDVTGVVLEEREVGTVTVSGNIQIVNASGGSLTSVILVVADTFDMNAARGEVPRGLRAPRTGVPNVAGDFSIDGVPDGSYVVLAAYENDDLVRDPDTNISGTDFVRIDVSIDDGRTLSMSDSFKVTEALAVFAPGATEPEAVNTAPTLRWADDSSEDWYDVRVFDAFGDEVWSSLELPGVSGQDEVSVEYGGPLDPGMYYQFRVSSWRQPGKGTAAPISATEDLRGVFFRPAE